MSSFDNVKIQNVRRTFSNKPNQTNKNDRNPTYNIVLYAVPPALFHLPS